MPVAFAFQRRSPYVPLFDAKMLKLKQSGEVDKVMDKYLNLKDNVVCDDSSFTTIGYQHIFSAFVLLATGVAAACTILLGENIKTCVRGEGKTKTSEKKIFVRKTHTLKLM